MTERQLLIGGEWVDGADGGYDVVNPATEEVVGVAPEASPGQALDAARAAQDAFPSRGRRRRPSTGPSCCSARPRRSRRASRTSCRP